MDEDKLNLQTLEDMILDENMIVSYVYLSRKLCIHANESKKLLKLFIDKIKKNKSKVQLDVKYIVSGLIGNNKGHTLVCAESELNQVRKSFQNIYFEHIYSVSKGNVCVDNGILTLVNKFGELSSCVGLLRNNTCIKYTQSDIENLKQQSLYAILKQEQPIINSVPIKKSNDNTTSKEEAVSNLKNVVTTKSDIKQKSGALNNSVESSLNKHNDIKTEQDTKSNKNKNNKGIAGFFSKQNNVTNGSNKKSHTTDIFVKEEIRNNNGKSKHNITKEKVNVIKKSNGNHIDHNVEKCNDVPIKIEKVTPKENKKSNKVETEKKTNVEASKKTHKSAKLMNKRKRLIQMSDSEDEIEKSDPFEEEKPILDKIESEDEIPPTPTTNTVKITSGVLNPRKKRKMVDKTYTDEDGYILTRKEEVYESCSDNDESVKIESKPEAKKEIKNNEIKIQDKKSKKKVSPPQKGKQATLMNFFKKV